MDGNRPVEIRWHGRGGQGAVTSAELLALSAIEEGKYAQAMPSFGPERRGAPVLAFTRVDSKGHVRIRSGIVQPDIVVVLDPGLIEIVDVTAGLKDGGTIVLNTTKSMEQVKKEFDGPWKLAVINATAIAKELLGVAIVNTTMLGALIKATGIVQLKSVEAPLMERFGGRGKNNIAACQKAYDEVVIAEPVMTAKSTRKPVPTEFVPTLKDMLPGTVVIEPGSAKSYKSGDWKSQHPEFEYEKCNKCGLCYIFCPEGCITQKDDGFFEANMFYCKGCGICARECPKDVITMIEES
jgi:pyruvate ferredoxin oxidoreductase gamma subunit